MKLSKTDAILLVLADGEWHSGLEFLTGGAGFTCSSYSQRIGELIAEGAPIQRRRHDEHGLGSYRLRSMYQTLFDPDEVVS